MEAKAIKVSELLSLDTSYVIPNFQRRYRWQKEQWELLFDDLCREAERNDTDQDGHFLGSIVLHRDSSGEDTGGKPWTVIDGQQRITTLVLLLAALRDALQFHGDIQAASYIDSDLISSINTVDSTNSSEKLVPTPLDRSQYLKTIRERKPSGRFGEAYDYFLKVSLQYRHSEGTPLLKLLNTLTSRLLLVRIEVERHDAVNSIFNTLNSKGLPLNAGDLIKNELLLAFDEQTAQQIYVDKWAALEEHLVADIRGKIDDRKLITFFWARELRFTRNVTQKNLFSIFEDRHRKTLKMTSSGSAKHSIALSEINEIWIDFQNYKMLEDQRHIGNKLSPEVRALLKFYKGWGSPIYIPIVLWILGALKRYPDRVAQSDVEGVLRVLQSFLVRRALCGYPTNNLNRLLSPIPSLLEQSVANTETDLDIRRTLENALQKQGTDWPSDVEVLQQIQTAPVLKSIRANQVRAVLELATGTETRSRNKLQTLLPRSLRADEAFELGITSTELDDALQILPFTLGNAFLPGSYSETGTIGVKANRIFAAGDTQISITKQIQERTEKLARDLLLQLIYPELKTLNLPTDNSEDRILNLLEVIPEKSWTCIEILADVSRCSIEFTIEQLSRYPAYHVRFVRETDGSILRGIPKNLAEHVALEDRSSQAVFGPKNFLNHEDLYAILDETDDHQ